MKFYFLKKHFETPDYLDSESLFPDRFTFASEQEKLPPKGSFLIINELSKGEHYLTKLKNKGKITTFDYRISCIDTEKINFSIEDICKLIKLRQGRFNDLGKLFLITDNLKKAEKLKKYLIDKNSFLQKYFDNAQKNRHQNTKDIVIEAKDAISTAFEIFRLPPRYYQNLTEGQILDWEINAMPEIMGKTPDGKYFLEVNNRRLSIQKVHNTPIEKCLGVDMIYNFYEEDRLIFIQYKCFNHENKKFYKSRDKHFDLEIKKMSDLAGVCNNRHASDCNQLRICDCPFFIKLCSRDIRSHREKPYGFYYAVCCWQKLTGQKPFISFNDEPKISNELFTELANFRLIGTRKGHSTEILKKLLDSNIDHRLILIFSETKINSQDN